MRERTLFEGTTRPMRLYPTRTAARSRPLQRDDAAIEEQTRDEIATSQASVAQTSALLDQVNGSLRQSVDPASWPIIATDPLPAAAEDLPVEDARRLR